MKKQATPKFMPSGRILGCKDQDDRRVLGTPSAILEVADELRVLTNLSFITRAGPGSISWRHGEAVIPTLGCKPSKTDPLNTKLQAFGLVSFPIDPAVEISDRHDPYFNLVDANAGDVVELPNIDTGPTRYYVSNPNASITGTLSDSSGLLLRIRSCGESSVNLAATLGARVTIKDDLVGFIVAYDTELQIIYAAPSSFVNAILADGLARFASAASVLHHNTQAKLLTFPGSISDVILGWEQAIVESNEPLLQAEDRLEILARRVYDARNGAILADQIMMVARQTQLAIDIVNNTIVVASEGIQGRTLVGLSDYLTELRPPGGWTSR